MRELLGNRIRHYRTLRNLSQVELAHALSVDKHTVWRWEDGRSWPEYPALEKIASTLQISIENLFEDISSPARVPTPEEALEVLKRAISAQKAPNPEIPADLALALKSAKPGQLEAVRAVLGIRPEHPTRPTAARSPARSK